MSDTEAGQGKTGSSKAGKVLAAARRLFIEHGYGETSMDAIAATADVSKATVYAHYASKKALFAAMVQHKCGAVTERMRVPDAIDDMPPAVALQRIGAGFLHAILSPESIPLLRVVIAETRRFPELGWIFYTAGPGVTHRGLVDYMQRARDRGALSITDCETAAAQFLGMLRGDLHLQLMLGLSLQDVALDDVAREAVETFLARYGG